MIFEDFDDETKSKLVGRWKTMSETDKTHFVNQASLALSIWGSDELGRRLVVDVLRSLIDNGSSTLADFGLYVDKLNKKNIAAVRLPKIKRASLILDGYRIKNELPSEPHHELGL